MSRRVLVCFAVVCSAITARWSLAQTADLIYHGGDIVTMDDGNPTAEALAVKDGKILAVGSEAEILKWKDDRTRVVDLNGKTLLPGFLDAHSHYINSLLVANQCKLYAPPAGPGKDVASIVAALKEFATQRNIQKGELIIGYGYDDNVMPEGRLLNRDDLDGAFPENPVRIDHVSMHGAVLNSLALDMYGFSADTKTPPGGVIVRKPGTNEPYGLIMETAFEPVIKLAQPMTAEQEIEWTKLGQMLYAQAGVTTAHEGATFLPQLKTIDRASKAGVNIIDVIAYPFISDVDNILNEFPLSQWGTYANRFKIGGVKITIDGSPQGRTAYFRKPYLTGGPGGEQNWTGELSASQNLVNEAVKKVYEMGVPLNLHANGDGAIDAFLQAHEFAAADDLNKARNVTIIHSQFLLKDQIPKFVAYQVRPSFYTLHTFYFAEAHIKNRGIEQAMYISPMRDAIDAGLRPSNHTDFIVAPLDQMFMLWTAVNRISRGGAQVGPDQRVTPLEGLKAMTIWVAEQYGEQDSKGSLEPGKLADLVLLDKNPLTINRFDIKDIKVVETIKEGETIYRADSSLSADSSMQGAWLLTRLGEQTIPADVETPSLNIGPDGAVSGYTGVNRFSGKLANAAGTLFGPMASTRRAGPPAAMKVEASFLEGLTTAATFKRSKDRLELLDANDEVLLVWKANQQ